MHQELRELLRDASGTSGFVTAANVDIRGFSSFFSDSTQAAAYLSSAYTRIIDDYFPDHSFFKPTGDGLLVVWEVDRENLKATVRHVVETSLRLDDQFEVICADDPLVNFETPDYVGIGIARGTATRISSGGKTLDFSGYPLNLATRLMDLARPRGVVLAESLGIDLIPDEQLERFDEESVFIRGIAETTPISVLVSEWVEVSPDLQQPIGAEVFWEKPETATFRDFKKRVPKFLHSLSHKPVGKADSIRLYLEYPAVTDSGRKSRKHLITSAFTAQSVYELPDGLKAVFDYGRIVAKLSENDVKDQWEIRCTVSYPAPLQVGEDDDERAGRTG